MTTPTAKPTTSATIATVDTPTVVKMNVVRVIVASSGVFSEQIDKKVHALAYFYRNGVTL